jgi:DNA topoisomerase-2
MVVYNQDSLPNNQGSIEKTNNARVSGATYTITGVIEAVNSTTLRITELPVRRWTEAYKEFLETLLPDSKNKDKEAFIEVILNGKHIHLILYVPS